MEIKMDGVEVKNFCPKKIFYPYPFFKKIFDPPKILNLKNFYSKNFEFGPHHSHIYFNITYKPSSKLKIYFKIKISAPTRLQDDGIWKGKTSKSCK